MNLKKFTDCTPVSSSRKRNVSTPVFITMKPDAIHFSREAVKSLLSVAKVRFFVNEEDGEFLVLEGEEGLPFMKEGKKTRSVIWHDASVLERVKALMPEGKKDDVRIYGEITEVEGKKGLLFYCKEVGEIRQRNPRS